MIRGTGGHLGVQKALPHLNPGASIILNTSAVGSIGMPVTSVYAATKAAVRSLARSFSADLVGRNIRVNALSPGAIQTPIVFRPVGTPELLRSYGERIMGRIAMKRMGSAEEVAKAALFLASDDSSYVLGAELAVDGGLTQL